MELVETNPNTRRRVSDILSQMTGIMAQVFACIEKSEQIEMTAEEAAIQFIGVIEGAVLIARAHNDVAYLRKGVRHYRNLIMALVP